MVDRRRSSGRKVMAGLVVAAVFSGAVPQPASSRVTRAMTEQFK